MLILTIRTDKPEAELGLYDCQNRIAHDVWLAHRHLAETIHAHIEMLVTDTEYVLKDIRGIVFFEGPGSFTGLRICASVANALAYSFEIPIVAIGESDEAKHSWVNMGTQMLIEGKSDDVALPVYGATATVTKQKK
jgi:tRNA threonylcarbamoyladenosine biosynthesis protein TsaB